MEFPSLYDNNHHKSLCSILEQNGTSNLEIEKRINNGRKVIVMLNSMLCSSIILGYTKPLNYKSTVESIMLYGSETWILNRRQQNKLLATEIDYWRCSTRKSRRERIRNRVISEMMEAEKKILERIEQRQLQWYGHVTRMENDRLAKTIMEWETEGRRRKGRSLGTRTVGIRYSLEKYGLRVEDATNREEWRRKTSQ
jgi:hypothetical protein